MRQETSFCGLPATGPLKPPSRGEAGAGKSTGKNLRVRMKVTQNQSLAALVRVLSWGIELSTSGLPRSRVSSRDAACCKAVRFGARLFQDTTPHQPNRGEHDARAPCSPAPARLTVRSWRFPRSATMSTTKYHSAVAPALQAAPSLLASVDSQILRRQRVSPATMPWGILSPDFAAIAIGEVDDRRTISTNHAPATICNVLHRVATGRTTRPVRSSGESY
jgi:hypothetical protein